MKLKFQAKVGGPKDRYRLLDYQPIEPLETCCEFMSGHWDNLVGLGLHGFPKPENVTVDFLTRVFFSADEVRTAGVAIAFCPWCGQEITLSHEVVGADPPLTGPSPAGRA